MNAIPAKVAGVEQITMVVPAPDDSLNPLVLAAAAIAKVDQVYTSKMLMKALAYGIETITKVDKIVVSGNRFVAAAKCAVFGQVRRYGGWSVRDSHCV